MKIKVCGLRDRENIRAVAALEPDYLGFIFYRPSPRFARGLFDSDAEALEHLSPEINKTAVFVNESAETIKQLIDRYHFDFIQLHGNESPEICKSLKNDAIIIKAFGIDADFDFNLLRAYKGKADLFLFDAKTDTHGGSGKTFGWDILDRYDLEIPFFLSGGLSPDNMEDALSIDHPQFYGVDLNSKFEASPGIKDINKLQKAFSIIKAHNK